jgi:hypothetical protein
LDFGRRATHGETARIRDLDKIQLDCASTH